MRNLKYRKFITTALIGSMLFSLYGCANKEEKQVETTTESQTTEEVLSEEEILQNQITEVAMNSYNEYTDFYESVGATQEDVIVMGNVINDKVEDYNVSQIQAALTLVDNSLLSDNMIQAIDNANFDNKKIKKIIKMPDVSEFIINSPDIKELVQKYEKLRNEALSELKETKRYTKATAKKIRKMTAKMETVEYDQDNGKMRSEMSYANSGGLYVAAATKFQMVNLCQLVTPNAIYINSPDGKKLKIGYTNEEIENNDLVDSYLRQRLQVPKDLYKKYNDARNSRIGTKYEEDMCTFSNQLLTEAGYLETSKADLLNKKKQLLISKKLNMQEMIDDKYTYTFTL